MSKAIYYFIIAVSLMQLAVLLVLSEFSISLNWLFLGIYLGLDSTNYIFSLVSSLIWIVASLFALDSTSKFECTCKYLMSIGMVFIGSNLAILSQDIMTFYIAFTLMSLPVYILVNLNNTAQQKFASNVYITFTIIGELFLFIAMIALIHLSNSVQFPIELNGFLPNWVIALIIFGFGIKVGMFPLHVTLPLIYKSASIPAAIVLAGVAINVGLLGWLRWLPFYEPLVHISLLVTILGVLGYLYSIFVGVMQTDPRALLGYSSISQMSLFALVLAAGIAAPAQWPLYLPIFLMMMLHHALAKSYLFVCCVYQPGHYYMKAFWWIGLLIASLGLAGAPLTAGVYAKDLLKQVAIDSHQLAFLKQWIWLSSFLTTCLLVRFTFILKISAPIENSNNNKLSNLGFALIFLSLMAITIYAWNEHITLLGNMVNSLIPICSALLLAIIIVLLLRKFDYKYSYMNKYFPAGDIAQLVTTALNKLYEPVSNISITGSNIISMQQINKSLSNLISESNDSNTVSWSLSSLSFFILIVILIGVFVLAK